MHQMSDEDYLRLIQQLTDQQYDDFDDDIIPDLEDAVWIPSEPEAKQKIKRNDKCVDLTNVARDKIKENLFQTTTLKIGKFFIRIKKYRGTIDNYESSLYMDIALYEEKLKTPSGLDCKILCSLNPVRDSRFSECEWTMYFKIPMCGHDIPTDTIVEIVKWLQFVNKMPAFV